MTVTTSKMPQKHLFASLRLPDTSNVSAAYLAPLMNLTFERYRLEVAVMPSVGWPLMWIFSRTNDATGLALWKGYFFIFACVMQLARRHHARAVRTLPFAIRQDQC